MIIIIGIIIIKINNTWNKVTVLSFLLKSLQGTKYADSVDQSYILC